MKFAFLLNFSNLGCYFTIFGVHKFCFLRNFFAFWHLTNTYFIPRLLTGTSIIPSNVSNDLCLSSFAPCQCKSRFSIKFFKSQLLLHNFGAHKVCFLRNFFWFWHLTNTFFMPRLLTGASIGPSTTSNDLYRSSFAPCPNTPNDIHAAVRRGGPGIFVVAIYQPHY